MRSENRSTKCFPEMETDPTNPIVVIGGAPTLAPNPTLSFADCLRHSGPRVSRRAALLSVAAATGAAGGDTQHAAHGRNRMHGLVNPYEFERRDGVAPVS